jgi:anti-sigma B factor antagonist
MTESRLATGSGRDAVLIEVAGDLDAVSADIARELLKSLADQPGVHLVVDLRRLEFLDSTGLGVLAGAASRVAHAGGEMALIRPAGGAVLRVLRVTGLEDALRTFGSPAELAEAPEPAPSLRRRLGIGPIVPPRPAQ